MFYCYIYIQKGGSFNICVVISLCFVVYFQREPLQFNIGDSSNAAEILELKQHIQQVCFSLYNLMWN